MGEHEFKLTVTWSSNSPGANTDPAFPTPIDFPHSPDEAPFTTFKVIITSVCQTDAYILDSIPPMSTPPREFYVYFMD